jgi:PucR C-terminal helix-turn-helix domain
MRRWEWLTAHTSSTNEKLGDLVARIGRTYAAREMVGELRAQIGIYERLPSEVSEGEVLEACRRNLRLWSRWLAAGVTPSESDLDVLRESVRARATQGVPLEDLLHAYRLGGRLGWQLLRRHATAAENEALLDAAELLMQYVDDVSAIVTAAYLGERQALVSEEERRTRDLVNRIVEGDALMSDEVVLAERVGVPARTGYVPFAVALPGTRPQRHATLAARLRAGGLCLAITEGDRVFGLASQPLGLADIGEGPHAVLAISGTTSRAQLATAREELELLVDFGRRAGLAGVVKREDYLPELLVARSPALASTLHDRILAPLRDAEHADLLHTLKTFVVCHLDRARTSAALHIHRNTLAYRLGRIKELTGLELGSPRDLTCVYLCLAAEEAGSR